jgi:NADPH2:quinone reductase
VGVIAGVGNDGDFRIGDRVAFFSGPGAWGEQVTTRAEFAMRVPDGVPEQVICQMPANTITALRILRAAERTAPGRAGVETPLLFTAAGSIVARILMIVARQRGLRVIGVVRSRAGAAILSDRFPDLPVITSADADWKAQVLQASDGELLDLVVDPVGGALSADLLDLVKDEGTVLFYGGLADEPLPIRSIGLAHRELTLRGVSASRWLSTSTLEERHADMKTAIEIAQAAPAQFPVAAEYDIADFAEAIEAFERPQRDGAVVLKSPAAER